MEKNESYLMTWDHIDKQFGELNGILRKMSDHNFELSGRPAVLGFEAGGKDVWNYMVMLFKVSDSFQVDFPKDSVYDYFDDNADRIGAYLSKNSPENGQVKVPTKGKFAQWVFRHKEKIWILFYGGRSPEKARTTDDYGDDIQVCSRPVDIPGVNFMARHGFVYDPDPINKVTPSYYAIRWNYIWKRNKRMRKKIHQLPRFQGSSPNFNM